MNGWDETPPPTWQEIAEAMGRRIEWLEGEVAFWKDQQKFASNMLATIHDLDEVAPALRKMLRQERDRRKRAEAELVRIMESSGGGEPTRFTAPVAGWYEVTSDGSPPRYLGPDKP